MLMILHLIGYSLMWAFRAMLAIICYALFWHISIFCMFGLYVTETSWQYAMWEGNKEL